MLTSRVACAKPVALAAACSRLPLRYRKSAIAKKVVWAAMPPSALPMARSVCPCHAVVTESTLPGKLVDMPTKTAPAMICPMPVRSASLTAIVANRVPAKPIITAQIENSPIMDQSGRVAIAGSIETSFVRIWPHLHRGGFTCPL